jgi:hypothetical protein
MSPPSLGPKNMPKKAIGVKTGGKRSQLLSLLLVACFHAGFYYSVLKMEVIYSSETSDYMALYTRRWNLS